MDNSLMEVLVTGTSVTTTRGGDENVATAICHIFQLVTNFSKQLADHASIVKSKTARLRNHRYMSMAVPVEPGSHSGAGPVGRFPLQTAQKGLVRLFQPIQINAYRLASEL